MTAAVEKVEAIGEGWQARIVAFEVHHLEETLIQLGESSTAGAERLFETAILTLLIDHQMPAGILNRRVAALIEIAEGLKTTRPGERFLP